MSGGHFDYIQYKFTDVIESIQRIIDNNGRAKTREELKEESRWYADDWYEKYPEDKFHYKYPDDIIEEFKKGVHYLKMAQIYTQRIDWLVSSDDGEDSFRKRLQEDLNKLNNEQHS